MPTTNEIFCNVLDSQNLQLVLVGESDALPLFHAVEDALESLRKFPATLAWALEEPSYETSLSFCRHAITALNAQTDLIYLIKSRASPVHVIGVIGLHHLKKNVSEAELGFWCRTTEQGKGQMLEAAKTLVAYAMSELQINKIHALVEEKNTASRKLCARMAMHIDATLLNDRKNPVSNQFVSIVRYVIESV